MKMKNKLTQDEMAVVAIYWSDAPGDTIKKIVDVVPYIDDMSMAEIAQKAIQKVAKMTEEEYDQTGENLKYIGSETDG